MLILAFLLLALGAAVIYVRCCGFVVWKTALLFAGCFIALNLFYLVVAWVASWFVNPSKPLSRQNSLCRSACVYASMIVTGYCWVRTHVRGAEKLPEAGRFLLVSNHRSGFDPIVVTQVLRRFNISFVSKPSNMEMPVLGRIGYGAGCLPIDRENDRKALTTILTAADYLKRGLCSMAIYPEGTRSRGSELLPFHAGSFKIAQRAGAPIAVACVRGSENVRRPHLLRSVDIYLDILEVIPAEQVKAMSTNELADYSRSLMEQQLKLEA